MNFPGPEESARAYVASTSKDLAKHDLFQLLDCNFDRYAKHLYELTFQQYLFRIWEQVLDRGTWSMLGAEELLQCRLLIWKIGQFPYMAKNLSWTDLDEQEILYEDWKLTTNRK